MVAKNVRKMRNLLLRPFLQVQLGVYTIAITLVFSILIAWQIYYSFNSLYILVLEVSELPDELGDMIGERIIYAMRWIVAIVGAYLLSTILTTIWYTHKLIGPMVAFKRHIRALKDGNYDSKIVLRKGDAFGDIADELNQLAEKLKTNKH